MLCVYYFYYRNLQPIRMQNKSWMWGIQLEVTYIQCTPYYLGSGKIVEEGVGNL